MGPRPVIPDIELGRVYDPAFRDAPVHYGSFGSLADFFGRDTPAHRHDRFYQLHFLETGRIELTLDDVTHALEAPLFFLTPPSVPHAFRTEPTAAGHVVTVAQALVWRLFDEDPSLARRHLGGPRCVALRGPEGRHQARQLSRLFGLLKREVEGRQEGSAAGIEALTRLILIAICRLVDSEGAATGGRRHELAALRRFHELVEREFARHWPLARYAGALNMTEARLTDLCNRLAARSPKRIVHDRLLLEARRFLAFSRLPVNEIAHALGFEDVGYFCRFFKRRQGATPSGYRVSLAENPGKVPSVDPKIHSVEAPAGPLSRVIERAPPGGAEQGRPP